ncbi:GNAT family N-acetyltransferase [Flagellimonas lutimaris]|uniref:GNAT family N-acetyltransferase n=1 Tax=Flagellimonas lutimaris TaxID=475082 RepID=UPI003F5CD320
MNFDNYSLRLLKASDLDAFFHLMKNNQNRLENFFAGIVAKTQTIDTTKRFLDDVEQKIKNKAYFPYIIIDVDSGTIAGFIDLKNIDWNIPKTEMGLFIDVQYEGKGIAAKAFYLVCQHCFEQHGFHKLFLRTHPTNTSAIAIAEKIGFKKEGLLRDDYRTTSGNLVDLLYYGLLHTDFI